MPLECYYKKTKMPSPSTHPFSKSLLTSAALSLSATALATLWPFQVLHSPFLGLQRKPFCLGALSFPLPALSSYSSIFSSRPRRIGSLLWSPGSPPFFNLSLSMGAVTLLALGNGAPDVFTSIAAASLPRYMFSPRWSILLSLLQTQKQGQKQRFPPTNRSRKGN